MNEPPTTWGRGLQFVTVVDEGFLPGAYALHNSLRANGFTGKVRILLEGTRAPYALPEAPGLQIDLTGERPAGMHAFVARWGLLAGLGEGNHVHADGDIFIERPCDFIFDCLNRGLLCSTEPWRRYDSRDVWVLRQCELAGIAPGLPDFEYVNAGLLGFALPRDKEFLQRQATLSQSLLAKVTGALQDRIFPQMDQDVLNLLIRDRIRSGGEVYSLSSWKLELSASETLWRNRPFPWTRQAGLEPKDKLKYMVHGASTRRPWLCSTGGGWKARLERFGILPMRRRILSRLTSYERGWAYYACTPGMAIPVESWAGAHGFTAHRHGLWRAAHGLTG
jgi:hypothetical protein